MCKTYHKDHKGDDREKHEASEVLGHIVRISIKEDDHILCVAKPDSSHARSGRRLIIERQDQKSATNQPVRHDENARRDDFLDRTMATLKRTHWIKHGAVARISVVKRHDDINVASKDKAKVDWQNGKQPLDCWLCVMSGGGGCKLKLGKPNKREIALLLLRRQFSRMSSQDLVSTSIALTFGSLLLLVGRFFCGNFRFVIKQR